MDTSSLGFKIGSAFFATILILSVTVIITLVKSDKVQQITDINSQVHIPIAQQTFRIDTLINRSASLLKDWITIGDMNTKRELQSNRQALNQQTQALANALNNQSNPSLNGNFKQLQVLLDDYAIHEERVIDIAQTPDNSPGLQLLNQHAAPLAQRILDQITDLIEDEVALAASAERKRLLKQLADFRGSTAYGLASIRAYLLTNHSHYLEAYQAQQIINDTSYQWLLNNKHLLNPAQQIAFDLLQGYRNQFNPLPDKMFALRQSNDWDVSHNILRQDLLPLTQQINASIEALNKEANQTLTRNLNKTSDLLQTVSWIGLSLLAIGILFSCLVALGVTRLMTSSIRQVITLADKIAEGDFDQNARLQGSSEMTALSNALQRMMTVLQSVSKHADKVAQGDYSENFNPQSQQDRLGKAIDRMTRNLRQSDIDNAHQNWIKTGQAQLADIMRGDLDIDAICQQAINFIGDYLKAHVGAIYLFDGNVLKLKTSYALKIRDNNDTEFRLGEGLVGQVAVEKKPIMFQQNETSDSLLHIHAGIQQAPAKAIALVPLINSQLAHNDLVGVLVFGHQQQLPQSHFELMQHMSESLAIAIESARSRSRLQELLEESQQQTEELQQQQDELKKANEELEQQTEMIRQSEEALRQKSESLEQTNQNLEIKTLELQQQKLDIETAREELEQKANLLSRANKYKSEFLANMSHELRTPLNALLVLSQSLARNKKGNLSKQQIDDLNMIHDSGKSLLTLISDILDLSKVEAGKLSLKVETFDLTSALQNLNHQMERLARDAKLTYHANFHPSLPQAIKSDQQRLIQVLHNLIGNAIKFTEKGGEVQLNVYPLSHALTAADQHFEPDNCIVFEIKDNGIGIAANKQQEIFEAFQQGDGATTRKYGGTGLGLTITRELVQLLNGHIQLHSEPGKGSCFTVYLPRILKEPAEAKTDDAIKSTWSTGAIRHPEPVPTPTIHNLGDDSHSATEADHPVLIIEDDDVFAKQLIDMAHEFGLKALACNEGRKALRLVIEYMPRAIILDLGLPDMDGLRVLDALKATRETRDIPVHIISGRDSKEQALKKGAMGFISKPVELEQLQQLLAKFSTLNQNDVKEVLCIEDDPSSCAALKRLLESSQLKVKTVNSGEQGIHALKTKAFDCVILDLNLPDIKDEQWFELCQKHGLRTPPTIIYTGQELSEKAYQKLLSYSDTIVVKGDGASDRLKDELQLFLHKISTPNKLGADEEPYQDSGTTFEGKRLLLVDDDLRNTYALSKVLNESGLEVILADNGQLALDKLEQQQNVDMILMDIMMPVMDGYQAISEIRQRYDTKYPIIALTAKAMPEDREKCLQAGANDFLTKPVDINKLTSMIKVWLNN